MLFFITVKADDCDPVAAFCFVYNKASGVYIAKVTKKEISGPSWAYVFSISEVLKGIPTKTVQVIAIRNSMPCLHEIDLDVGASYLICIGRYRGANRLLGEDKYAAIPLAKASKELELLRKLKSQKQTVMQPCPS